jgi:hypothetical protein
MGDIGKDVSSIAFALIGVATIALLVSRSDDTVKVVKGSAAAFGGLLGVVTLQNNYMNLFSA